MKTANYAPVYCALYPGLAEIARQHGYALAIHGTLARDFDLVCIPWSDREPDTPPLVIDDICSQFAIRQIGGLTEKPHGRLAYTLSIGHGECAIDLSFVSIPIIQPADAQRETKA